MRKRHAFRPTILDQLEDRLVLSTPGVTNPPITIAQTPTATPFPTADYNQIANALNQAFNNFRTTYQADEASYLAVAGGGSPTVPGISTQADLQNATTQGITQLNAQITSILTQVPGALTGLLPFMEFQLNSQDAGSLQSILNGISGTNGPNGGPDTGLYAPTSAAAIDNAQLSLNDMLSTYFFAVNQGRAFGFSGGTAAQAQLPDYATTAGSVNTAFDGFRTGYNVSVSDFLNTTPNGSGTGTTNLAALQAANTQGANTLVQSLATGLNGVPGASTGLIPFQQLQVNGQFTGGMNQAINNIPATTGANGTAGALFSTAGNNVVNGSQLAANDILSVYFFGWNQGLNSSGFGSPAFTIDTSRGNPLSPAHLAIVNQHAQGITQAFNQFQTSFTNALNNTLFANVTPGANGQVDLTPNRAAFNAQVATALNALNSGIATSLSPSPLTANTLLPSIQQSLLANDLTGLQGQLAALTLPTDINGTTNAAFLANTNNLVNLAFLDTMARLNAFALNPNFAFTPFTTSNSFLFGPFGTQFFNFPLNNTLTTTIPVTTTTTTTPA